jgi:hypothetical protein
MKKKRIVG